MSDDPNATVLGKTMSIDDAELKLLDDYEGMDYERVSIVVTLCNDRIEQDCAKIYSANVYKWCADVDRLSKDDWNYELYIQNKYHGKENNI